MIVAKTIIFEDEPHTSSIASLFLLNEYYQSLDEDFMSETKEIQLYLDRRHEFLTKILKKEGVLHCHYCPKSNLEIGERLISKSSINNANKNLATIDHKNPVSSGIDKLDETNWVVACKGCNIKKGSTDYNTFVKLN